MIVYAKFKGTESLGYKNGETYLLSFHTEYSKDIPNGEIKITNYKAEPYKYDSLKLFLDNWEVL